MPASSELVSRGSVASNHTRDEKAFTWSKVQLASIPESESLDLAPFFPCDEVMRRGSARLGSASTVGKAGRAG